MADKSANSIPPWRELTHFDDYINENFMDGSKWEDISRVIGEFMYLHTILLILYHARSVFR